MRKKTKKSHKRKQKSVKQIIKQVAAGLIAESKEPIIPLTAKQERFAQEVAKGVSTLADAYRIAYDTEGMKASTINEAASRLAGDSKIIARVDRLRKSALALLQYDISTYFEELEQERQEAKMPQGISMTSSPSVSLKATIEKGKVAGHCVDRKELTGANGEPLIPTVIRITGLEPKKEQGVENG